MDRGGCGVFGLLQFGALLSPVRLAPGVGLNCQPSCVLTLLPQKFHFWEFISFVAPESVGRGRGDQFCGPGLRFRANVRMGGRAQASEEDKKDREWIWREHDFMLLCLQQHRDVLGPWGTMSPARSPQGRMVGKQ